MGDAIGEFVVGGVEVLLYYCRDDTLSVRQFGACLCHVIKSSVFLRQRRPSRVTVTMYLAKGQSGNSITLTGHPRSRTTS